MRIRSWSVTDVGRVRQANEDFYSSDDEIGLYVVCDGMGGHKGGEVASRVATEAITEHIRSARDEILAIPEEQRAERRRQAATLISEAIQAGSAAVWNMAQEDDELRGMGCTAVCLWLIGTDGIVGHVGDSRLDLVRDGNLFHLTEDHTLYQLHQRTGVVPGGKKISKNVLTRAVGIQESVQVDTVTVDLLAGDRLVLCSDGLHNYIGDEDLSYMLRDLGSAPAKRLVDLANKRGGKDNITTIVVAIGEDGSSDREEALARLEAFRKMPLFHYFSFKQLMAVSGIAETVHYPPGEVLFEEGQPGSDLYILLRGEVAIIQAGAELARLGPGGHFGEMGLVDDAPRSATVRAASPITSAVIRRDVLMDLLRREPPLAVKLLWSFVQTLSGRLRSVNQDLSDAKKQLLSQAFKDLANHLGPFEAGED